LDMFDVFRNTFVFLPTAGWNYVISNIFTQLNYGNKKTSIL